MPTKSLVIFVEVFRDGVYEDFSSPKGGDTVIDVGAHIGTFTVRAAELVGDKGLAVLLNLNQETSVLFPAI